MLTLLRCESRPSPFIPATFDSQCERFENSLIQPLSFQTEAIAAAVEPPKKAKIDENKKAPTGVRKGLFHARAAQFKAMNRASAPKQAAAAVDPQMNLSEAISKPMGAKKRTVKKALPLPAQLAPIATPVTYPPNTAKEISLAFFVKNREVVLPWEARLPCLN